MKTKLKGVFVCCVAFALNASATTPIITSQPQSVTINNASTANFAVTAENAATYQWMFGTTAVSGATNATLILDDVATNQAGSYSVVVTSSTGNSTNSQPAQLTIVPGTIVQLTLSTYADGTSSNFLVQLFNHDKPATVENFIHYITSGAYSNTFFDRDVADFVLQGGDYTSFDRTTNELGGNRVSTGTNIFPSQVDSEFNVGPLIRNTFGTLAMALSPGDSDSTSGAFFLNLADNSTNLDGQNGTFTVFGRILSGTNILQYFNTLSAPSNGIFDLSATIPTLPVNYDGTNEPNNANLFYCDFAFQTPPPVDTNPPTVSIAFPAPNAVLTNGSLLTVQGTAHDDVGLAEVFCVLTSLTGAYGDESLTNAALGTTNWSLDLVSELGTIEPGVYQLTAFAQDGAGNLSAPATEYFTNLVQLTLITNVAGQLTTNAQYLVPGQQYSVTATPGNGELFEYWQNQGVLSLDSVQSFTAETNFTLIVTFVPNTLPAGLAITSPAAGSEVEAANGELTISGTLPSSITVTQLTCQLFAQSNAVTAPLAAGINGASWSLAVSNLAGGPYTVVVVAEDSSGQEGLVTESFTTLIAPPVIISQPSSITVNTGSSADFSVTANNAASYQWELVGTGPIAGATNATLTLDDVSAGQSGSSYLVVVTASDGETETSMPAVLTIVPGTIVQFTLSKYADGTSSNFLVQLFDHDKPATVANFIHYMTSGAYSNMFFDRCVPGLVLQGGTYDAFNRTNAKPGIQAISLYDSYGINGANSGIPFPDQVDSEFGDGPFIPNTFGTLAMALSAGQSNSATGAFFFNLADNSANLDVQSGGFTVFGRILSGTNVLQFFNTLSEGDGIIDYQEFVTGATETTLPVNYIGTNEPANANLYFCDFTLSNPPAYNTGILPTVSVTSPLAGQLFTNGGSIVVQGIAGTNQWTGLARVRLDFLPQSGNDQGQPFGDDAIGTTNWYLPISSDFGTLPPGLYDIRAVSQDGYGILGLADTSSYFTVLANLVIATNGVGATQISPAPVNLPGTYLNPGTDYTISAVPGAGQTFYTWNNDGVESINQPITISGNKDQTLTVTFIATNLPAGLAITTPGSSGQLDITNGIATFAGILPPGITVTQLTCQLFSGFVAVGNPQTATVNGTNWSLTVSNLSAASYTVYALGYDSTGRSGLVSKNFDVTDYIQLTVVTHGPGSITPEPSGSYIPAGSYTFKAVPARGQSFYSWSDGTTLSINPSETINLTSSETLTVTFVSNDLPAGISFTYPAANAKVPTNSVSLKGKVAKSAGLTTITAQFYSKTTSTSVGGPMVTTGNGTWSIPAVQFVPGEYVVQALASNAAGKTTVISEAFTILTPLSVAVTGSGTTTITNGTYLESGTTYSIKAIPKPGELFYYWYTGSYSSISPTIPFVMSTGLALTATFISNALPKAVSFTYPRANSQVPTNSFMLTGNVSASFTNVQVSCQLFSNTLPVSAEEPATVNGTAWSFPITDLQQGIYTVVAIAYDTTGRETLISENFELNFYPNIAGTYYGVFFSTNIATNNAGFFKLTLDGSGVISGKLQFPAAAPYTVSYPLGPSGGAELAGAGFDKTELYFNVNFDLTNGTDTVIGYVYSVGTLATFTGYRAVTELPSNTVAGRYVLDLETIANQAGSGPTNDGYATVSVGSTGGLTLGGTLADNTPFSEAVGVSKDGVWPVFATLYGGHGMLIGWETNVIGANGSAGSTGTLYWVKAPTRDTYFTSGFSIEAASTGANYVPPVAGTQYQVVFGGGSVNPALNNLLNVSPSGQFAPVAGAPDKLVISLSAAGVITGTIYNPADNKTLPIRGAFSSPSLGGSGFVLDTNGQTDPFQITLVP